MHGFVISGTHSGCGKTTVTLGLLAALRRKGWDTQSFKAGPDFIDSGLHQLITGRPSRNLDIWMCGKESVAHCFEKHAHTADVAIIEGVMGLHDGDFSTADLARLLDMPVILVVDAYGMAESAGAVVKGFVEYNKELQTNDSNELQVTSNESKTKGESGDSSLVTRHLSPPSDPLLVTRHSSLVTDNSSLPSDSSLNWAGVIFNRVASDSHYKRLKNSVRGVRVLGYLPRNLAFEIPHRHLGLHIAEETPIADKNIEKLADAVLEHINIEELMRKAAKQERKPEACNPSPVARIAVAYDKAFCFYYEDNLDFLRDAGAEIIRFSPLSDRRIPAHADAVYIGGGYPELHADILSGNTSMLESVHAWVASGRPLYAECGGLMYLSQGIHDFEGSFFPMTKVFPFETRMKKGKSHLGYREIQLNEDCIMGNKGDVCRGHEFHYSEIINGRDASSVMGNEEQKGLSLFTDGAKRSRRIGTVPSGLDPSRITHYASRSLTLCYSVRDRSGLRLEDEGYRIKNTLASYIHVHFGSNTRLADSFLNFIKEKPWRA